MITDAPARLFGLKGRGRIEVGNHADLVVFDPATIDSEPATLVADLPGDAKRLTADSIGVVRVLVNGVETVADGKATGATPGAILRSGRDTETVLTGAAQMIEATGLWSISSTKRAAATPDAVMLVDQDERTMTFAEYREAVERAAAGFAAHGVGQGDVVSWQLPTWIESFVLVGALARLGAVQNPILPIYRKREVAFVCQQAKTQAAGRAERVARLRLPRHGQRDRGRGRRPRRAHRRQGAAGRRSVAAAACGRSSRRRPRPLALLHVGHDRRPEGRAAHRRHDHGDGHRDERAHRAHRRRPQRAGVPLHAHRRDHVAVLDAARRLPHDPRRGVRSRDHAAGAGSAKASRSPARARRSTWRTSPRSARSPDDEAVPERARLPWRRRAQAAAAALRPEERTRRRRHRVGLRAHRGADHRHGAASPTPTKCSRRHRRPRHARRGSCAPSRSKARSPASAKKARSAPRRRS